MEMGRIPLAAVIAFLALRTDPGLAAELAGPDVDPSEGAGLAALARTAMHAYLKDRTPADQLPLPPELARLERRPHAACVTLRREGKVVAQVVQTGNSLPRNVIAASLAAMRSPDLPNIVTQAVLESLVVEVEVLGPPVLVGQEKVGDQVDLEGRRKLDAELEKLFQPGLAGLKLTRGQASAYTLPSVAYTHALNLAGMRRWCLENLALDRESAAQMPQWSLFLSQQYVSFPEGRVVHLYRGKVLVPPEAVDEAVLAGSAERIAQYLAASQGLDGRLMAYDQPALLDHLYATWALARLPATRKDKKLSACLNAALGYAAGFVRQKGQAAYVESEQPEDQTAATSLMVLALRAAEDNSAAGLQLRQKLTEAVRTAAAAAELPGRLDGAGPIGASPKAVCLARLALTAGPDSPTPVRLPGLGERAEGLSGLERLWALRAGVPVSTAAGDLARHFQEVLTATGLAFAAPTAPPDERGGLALPGLPPRTELTALAGIVLKQALADAGPARAAESAELAARRLEARRFCCRMIYRPLEAYFAEHPAAWEGAVRVAPETATVSLRAAAAALEALAE